MQRLTILRVCPEPTWAAAILDNRLDLAAQQQLSYPEVLSDLLGIEAAARRERYLKTRTRLAHLPFHRTLEQFDFGFQPSIDESQVRELASLTFVNQASNPEDQSWVLPRLCPQPVASFAQRVRLSRPEAEQISRSFILSSESGFDAVAEQALQSGWGLYQLETDHDPMITKPREVAEILLNIAGQDVPK